MVVRDQQRNAARERGRERFARRRWDDAYTLLVSAQGSLDPDEQLMLAMSAYLLGREEDCTTHLERSFHDLVDRGDVERAARCAFWLSFVLLNRGEVARGGGWVARGHALLPPDGADCVEHGYLLVPSAVQQLYAGDGDAAEQLFGRVLAIGSRFGDADLVTLARLGSGQALILEGRIREALPLLDEAMVAVTADEVSPVVAGLVYCAVIEACQDTFDLRRAQEWTIALTEWCDTQPDLVPYRGQCQIHRVELLRLSGDWTHAMTEATRARHRMSRPPREPAVGAAIYQEAELHRLRGRLQRAEEAYAEASAYGHDPQPGLARLRIAQGAAEAAVASLRRALGEAGGRAGRPRLLSALVEAELAAGELDAAEAAAGELAEIAGEHEVLLLRALAAQATAAVAMARDDPGVGLREARRAWTIWREFGAPYEAARARVLVGLACGALGDRDAAELELAAARRAFEQLGATLDLAHLDVAAGRSAKPPDGGLTPREAEVLRLVAAGRTNRSVAAELHLSDKTVARHLSNIYRKLGLSSRAGATAWAYEHDLLGG
jgi:ATP/maltotriose-dependent transcriptional regulator MalT